MPTLGRQTSWFSRQLGRMAAAVFFLSFIALMIVTALVIRLDYGPLQIDRAKRIVTQQINNRFDESLLSLGKLSVTRQDSRILVQANNVDLRDAEGSELFSFPSAVAEFDQSEMLKGQFAPQVLRVSGASIKVERDKEGRLKYLPRSGSGTVSSYESLDQILTQVAGQTGLEQFKKIQFEDTIIIYQNGATGATFAIVDANVTATRDGNVFDFQTTVGGEDDTFSNVGMLLSLRHRLGEEESDLKIQFDNAWVKDFAGEFEGFEFLEKVDAPISGSLTAKILDTAQTSELIGSFKVGQGQIEGLLPDRNLQLSEASAYFSYDLKERKTTIDEFSLSSDLVSFTAEGSLIFEGNIGDPIQSVLSDLELADIAITDESSFDAPQAFQSAGVVSDYNLQTMALTIQELVLQDHETFYQANGQTWISEGKVNNRYRLRIDQMNASRVKQLWPKWAIPKTRKWVTQNISDGRVVDLHGVIGTIDGRSEVNIDFAFQDAVARYLKFMPVLKKGNGTAQLTENQFTMRLNSGGITAPDGKPVDMAGSQIFIPNIKVRPAPGEVTLVAKGGLRSTLELLNVPKFKFMDQAGLSTNFGSGRVALNGLFKLPLTKKVKIADVDFKLSGDLKNFNSKSLLKGHSLAAERLKFSTSQKGIDIIGPVAVDGSSANIKWAMGFGSQAKKGSRLTATTALNNKVLSSFNVALPKGTVSGSTKGNIDVVLKKGQAPQFKLVSDLVGAGLSIPSLNWSKAKSKSGKLVVAGSFGASPKIDQLDISANGLSTNAKVSLSSSGKLQKATFRNLKVGKWLDTEAVLTPVSGGTRIALNGGRADMRQLPSGGTGNGQMDVNLDRLVIQSGIVLTNVKTKLRKGKASNFTGNVNGKSPIKGVLRPSSKGTDIEITSANAGQLLNAAGLLTTVRGGALKVRLKPTGKKGGYNGTLRIDTIRLKGNKPVTELLNAMSVVGLVQQLNGEGIHFDTVRSAFSLSPQGAHIKELSAIGASMGITVNGYYGSKSKAVDFQGVVTPIYLLNGVFERLLGNLAGRRRGEGLFSFKYTMKGKASKPKIKVNPLSILTPGAFREIFKTPAPKPQN